MGVYRDDTDRTEEKIEDTRELLNTAIITKCSQSKILDISRALDTLIEEYLISNSNSSKTEP